MGSVSNQVHQTANSTRTECDNTILVIASLTMGKERGAALIQESTKRSLTIGISDQ